MILEQAREGAVGAAVTSGPVAGGVEKHQRWAEAEAEVAEEPVAPREAEESRKESNRREYEEAE